MVENLTHYSHVDYSTAGKWLNCWCSKSFAVEKSYIVELKEEQGVFWVTDSGNGTMVNKSVHKSFDNLEEAAFYYFMVI